MNKILIKGGQIIDPKNKMNFTGDLLIADGFIAGIGKEIVDTEAEVIDAAGKLVVPGLVDIHCHLREPGFEAKEDFESGTKAAAAGGFTSVCCMPNTRPVADSPAIIGYIKEKTEQLGYCRVYPIGAISKGSQGKELAEFGAMLKAGAVAFSDDGRPVETGEMMRLALDYSRIFDVPIIAHEEDCSLVNEGDMHEGYVSTVLGLRGIPAAAEEVMIARDIILARLTGAHLHVAHVSTKGGVELIKNGKAEGLHITAEVTPHHLTLTDAAIGNYDTNAKVNPPLREESDVEALIEALRDGVIDCVATDHAPHTIEDKVREFHYAANGISGFETALPVLWTYLVATGKLSADQLIERMSSAPAALLGLPVGGLDLGDLGDVTILDPNLKREVRRADFYSKGKTLPMKEKNCNVGPFARFAKGSL